MGEKPNITIAKNRILVSIIDKSITKAGIHLSTDKHVFHQEGYVIISNQKNELFDLKVGDHIIYDKAVETIKINNINYSLIYETNIKYIKNV